MFEGLQQKWKVSPGRLFLILLTFAFGGSLAGFMAKKVMALLAMELGLLWTLIYILIVTLLWPISVILVSIFTGQFLFFKGYLRRMAMRMGLMKEGSEKRK